jgi:hypothetical protein
MAAAPPPNPITTAPMNSRMPSSTAEDNRDDCHMDEQAVTGDRLAVLDRPHTLLDLFHFRQWPATFS